MRRASFFLLFFFLFSTFLSAEKIKSFQSFNDIYEDASVVITEKILYEFDTPKHGIYRDIPLEIKIKGKIKKIPFKLHSITLDNQAVSYTKEFFRTSNGQRNIRLIIGDKNRLIQGEHLFTISYELSDVLIPYCKAKKDCISLNSIGTKWSVPIFNIKAQYRLPSILVDRVDVKTFTGTFASKESKAKLKWINAQELLVTVDTLAPFEGLTTSFYFSHGLLQESTQTVTNRFFEYWYLIFIAVFAYIYRMKKRFSSYKAYYAVTPYYEPPNNLSSLEASFILKGKIPPKDFSAALLELATKGYISISKEDKKTVLKKEKDADSLLSTELKQFLEALFEKEDTITLEANKSLKKNLKALYKEINTLVAQKLIENNIIKEEPQKTKKRFLLTLLPALIVAFAYTFYYIWQNYGLDLAIFVLFPLFFSYISLSMFFKSSTRFGKVVAFVIFLLGGVGMLAINFQDFTLLKELFISPLGATYLLIAFLASLSNELAYTQKGLELKAYLLGLKEFMQRVKEDELKRRLQNEPLYLEKLLPYAIIFNLNSHWLEFFTKLAPQQPLWYEGDMSELRNIDREFASLFASDSASSNGGFGGDGSSSGGGVGGGGGGSW